MSILGVDIGSSTVKIIEFENDKIKSKAIFREKNPEENIKEFFKINNIQVLEKVVLTGIGADKITLKNINVPVYKAEEFVAIATGGLFLSQKEKAIIVSVGTGTALIKATPEEVRHLGGTGVGAGTLLNLCKRFLDVNSFDEILELSKNGNLGKIDLRIGDVTDKEITTLPKELTLANFGKFEEDAKKEDIVLGIVNMIFEVIGMMVAFSSINLDFKDAVLIGNIAALPMVDDILRKIEFTHGINFIVPEDAEFAVAIGAIKSLE